MSSALLLAVVVLLAGVLVPLAFPRWPVWARAAWRVATLVLLSILAPYAFGSPLRPAAGADMAWDRLWQEVVAVGWWVVAARCLAGVARLALSMWGRSRETQILSDLFGACIYATVALVVVDVVFAVPVGGLIATSGIVAVVIGLALQSTLADVFSGIAIDIERPYKTDDRLWIEGGIEGRVQEMNWRSTRLVTIHGDVAIVPNSVMAKSRLVNHSLPALVRRAAVEVVLDPRIMPERCRAALDAAIRGCVLPLPSPAPSVHMTALRGDGAAYEITFSATADDLGDAKAEVLSEVQRHLSHAAIPMAVVGIPEMPSMTLPGASQLLERSDVFGILASHDRDLLAAEMQEVTFEEGATLYEQGEMVDAFCLIAAGVISISRRQPDGSTIVRRAGPGACLGLVALVMATPFGATASALTAARTYRLGKDAIARAIEAQPELATGLERLAARSQATINQDFATEEKERSLEQADLFRSRLRAFVNRLRRDQASADTGGVR